MIFFGALKDLLPETIAMLDDCLTRRELLALYEMLVAWERQLDPSDESLPLKSLENTPPYRFSDPSNVASCC